MTVPNTGPALTQAWRAILKAKNGLYSYYTNVNSTHYVMNHNFQVINYYMCSGYNADIHDFLMLDNGNVLMMAYDPQTVDMSEIVTGGHPDATVIGFIIQELDANRNVVFSGEAGTISK